MPESSERAFYENLDYWNAERYTGPQSERVRLALEWLPAGSGSLLDLGCGNGVLANRVTGRSVIGLDRSFTALRHVRTPRCQADAAVLPFGDGSFDVVVSMEMIEHLPVPLYEPALAEMCRVARRYLLITVPYCEDLAAAHVICPSCGCHFHPYQHMRSYGQAELEQLFQAGGFFLVRAEGIIARQVLRFPGLRRIMAWLLGRRAAFPWFAICPQCGYRHAHAGPPNEPSAPARRGGALLRRVWPKWRTYTWWMALYKRLDASDESSSGGREG